MEFELNFVEFVAAFFMFVIFCGFSWCCYSGFVYIGQKARSQQQRRAYTGSRTRPSLSQSEPTIYVSPANLPPPPKYEAMAPPSYEEVVGIHYPQYQIPVQPITVPITTALAQNSTDVSPSGSRTDGSRTDGSRTDEPQTVITVTTDDKTTVTVATS